MALVYCTKCGHQVSKTAPRCPGCGALGPAAKSAQALKQGVSRLPPDNSPTQPPRNYYPNPSSNRPVVRPHSNAVIGSLEGAARKVSLTALILALFCFVLPFVTFSCGPVAMTFSGIEMVTGTTVQLPQPYGPPESRRVDPEGWAVLAFLVAIAGLGFGFAKAKSLSVGSPASAGLSVLSLVYLKSKLESDALQQGGGAIQVNWQVGYYLTVIFLLIAIGASVYSTLSGLSKDKTRMVGTHMLAYMGDGAWKCLECDEARPDAESFENFNCQG